LSDWSSGFGYDHGSKPHIKNLGNEPVGVVRCPALLVSTRKDQSIMQSTTLYFKEGASDKVYQASLEPHNNGWVVRFAYGRRGATLTAGTKTPAPIALDQAERIYRKLITEKMAKGYAPGEAGTPYGGGESDTGIRPQLLNPLTETELEGLLDDDDFWLQPKLDGRRLLIQKRENQVIGINRRGLECGIPETLRSAALSFDGDFLVDGEAIGDVLHVFDLLQKDGRDLRPLPYKHRSEELGRLLTSRTQSSLRLVPTYQGKLKRKETAVMREQKMEGVVLKRASAPFSAGRPSSGGDQRKFKFTKTVSVIVSAINRQRSVAMSLWEEDVLHFAGHVTIPPNHPVPTIGQVAEVRYLYALPESGVLYQPVYLGTREDVTSTECLRAQLEYKAA
jgi:bifunctional non-homologous end joining protein LigD